MNTAEGRENMQGVKFFFFLFRSDKMESKFH